MQFRVDGNLKDGERRIIGVATDEASNEGQKASLGGTHGSIPAVWAALSAEIAATPVGGYDAPEERQVKKEAAAPATKLR